jgi:hypothetical protein
MPADDFRKTILAEMQSLLKPIGFRKTRTLFSADVNDVVLFVQLQAHSKKSTKDFLVVTVNLGIFSRTVAERAGNTHEPNIYEAHWRQRIGFLMPERADKWWEISNEAEANLCASEITSVLANHALPEMQSLNSTESLKSLWQTGKSPGQTDYQRRQHLEALETKSG